MSTNIGTIIPIYKKERGTKMLIYNFREIGDKLYKIRKSKGLTQLEVAERANLSDRGYADIERGTVNMRIETFLQICNALNINPNDVLTTNQLEEHDIQDILQLLKKCSPTEQKTALTLLTVYLKSLNL